jgi:guanine deaminase
MAQKNKFLKIAIDEAKKGISKNHGGPFGAVVVKNGKIIAVAHNEVPHKNDPTAHAEMLAIRKASSKLGTFNLSGCELYISCEPCPMCLSAIIWSGISKIYFGCTRKDAARIGFRDDLIYEILKGNKKKPLEEIKLCRADCLKVFRKWFNNKDEINY